MVSALSRFRNFDQCLLREVRLVRFGTELELEFEYIWDDHRADGVLLAEPFPRVVIRLEVVDSVDMRLELPPGLLEDPNEVNWGLSEVAMVRVEKLPHEDRRHRLEVRWETDRRITATFRRMRIHDVGGESPQ